MAKRDREKEFEKHLKSGDAFTRRDEADDKLFYARDRFVNHLDSLALSTVEKLIGTLILEWRPAILDLMASWDSHVPDSVKPERLVGLGLNENELKGNRKLTGHVIHDLNRNPRLPFEDASFDVVLNTVSVDYMTQPFEVFRDVGRILKPGGLFLVIFSNRMFPQKAVKIWREASEQERLMLVEDCFGAAGLFETPVIHISKGKPRPKEDKHAGRGMPSDPVYSVYADRTGGKGRKRPDPGLVSSFMGQLIKTDHKERREKVRKTLRCPHCGERMKKWLVPDSPFAAWDTEYMYICFNDSCPYLVRGWDVMNRQGNRGVSYRQMYNPKNECLLPVPVPNLKALRESIVEEEPF